MYGLNIDKDVDEIISNCNVCPKYQNLNPCEPYLRPEIPEDVWNKVATDLFLCLNRLHLHLIDYTSKFFKLVQLPNAS